MASPKAKLKLTGLLQEPRLPRTGRPAVERFRVSLKRAFPIATRERAQPKATIAFWRGVTLWPPHKPDCSIGREPLRLTLEHGMQTIIAQRMGLQGQDGHWGWSGNSLNLAYLPSRPWQVSCYLPKWPWACLWTLVSIHKHSLTIEHLLHAMYCVR